MTKQPKRRPKPDYYFVCGWDDLSSKQKAAFDSITSNFYDGRITKHEADRQLNYFRIPAMLNSEIPY